MKPWNKGLTKETDRRIKSNSKPWNKGLTKETDERVEMISNSEDRARQISHALKGRIKSKEWKEKIGRAHAGVKLSEDHKKSISMASRGKKHPGITGQKHPFFGKRRPEISSLMTRLNQDPQFVQLRIKGLVKRPTCPEQKLIELIEQHCLPFKYVGNGNLMIGRKNPDFAGLLGFENKLIEVFGDYWHSEELGRETPESRIAYFKERGYDARVVWEHEINKEPAKVLEEIMEWTS